ncbi:DNA primase family protein [Mammaliicoccus sciuri]|uniref:DNA primase family protein n=1 Tax=Mammaliicoccus sciuri TaxID=1296 RepID=UPI002DB950EF|nr:phage/plasmid primase, P4 family [Mammaliicoccus sciuri]MEB6231406.1 phage/plasmid primase, P4 family [Mammaliicoccus sciuri]
MELPDDIRKIIEENQTPHQSTFFSSKGVFLHFEFAQYLQEKHNGVLLDGKPHIFTGKKYEPLDVITIRSLTLNYIPSLKESQNKEVYYKLYALCSQKTVHHAPPQYIGVKNGIYDLFTGELKPFSPDIYITNIMNVEYDPNIKSYDVDNFIANISNDDKDIQKLIIQLIGYGLYRENFLQKAFFFYSPGGNGKSTLFKLLHHFYGSENTTALSFKDIQSRFKPASLQGKLVNIADDIDASYITETGNYKSIVTGDDINAERKGQDDFNFSPYVKLLFAGNTLPQTNDRTDGFYRRMVIIPMLRKFGDGHHKIDPTLIHRLKEPKNLSALLNKALTGLKQIIDDTYMHVPNISRELVDKYKYENDPFMQFIEEAHDDKYREIPVVEGRPTDKAFQIYVQWSERNRHATVSKTKFTQEMRRLGFDTKVRRSADNEGKPTRFYAKDSTAIFYDFHGLVIQ